MPTAATFEAFERELSRLVDSFGRRLAELKQPGYAEAQLRSDFLDPFFAALGWDMANRAGFIQKEREVEIESATQIGGGRKRADYLFRADKRERFVCEAKKPAEELHARYAFQAKRYAWNKGVFVALLTDFEELKIYLVGGKPRLDEPQVGEWKTWHFRQYPLLARELWDLLARDRVAAGSIDQAIDALPKRATATGRGKARQQWLIKPDRTRTLDTDFLEFLDVTRRDLASDIYKNNDHDELLADNKLTEACQRIIDRILFLRICEDRDIDTGEKLQSIVDKWRKNTGNDDSGRRARQQPLDVLREEPPAYHVAGGIRAPKESLWRRVREHFDTLDRRPPSHVPYFNGNLFKEHPCDKLSVGDEWLAGFIGELSDDESSYLFDVIPVEILGSVYERFLGKIVRPHGKGITVEEKPEVRKAGGVYYTPRYIVDYIVEQTAGKLLDQIFVGDDVRSLKLKTDSQSLVTSAPTIKDFAQRTAALRLLDPACGSGSFLIRAFERVCEHWQKRLTADLRYAVGDEVTSLKSNPVGDEVTSLQSNPVGDEVTSLKPNPVGDDVTSLKPNPVGDDVRSLQSNPVGDDVRSLQSKEENQSLLTSATTSDTGRSRGNEAQTEKTFSQRLLTSSPTFKEWQKKHRHLCWVNPDTGDVQLTVALKRQILTQNIYGVDLDSAAVEVTQLSLYLKMLEHENRTTLQRQRELLADETEIALLPPLQDNIKCGNSLIASDFSMMPEDLVRVHAFDWPVQFQSIMRAGGFDAVVGNPPYIRIQTLQETDPAVVEYFKETYNSATQGNYDIYVAFIERVLGLLNKSGKLGYIVPHKFFNAQYGEPLRGLLAEGQHLNEIVHFGDQQVFEGASTYTCLFFLTKKPSTSFRFRKVNDLAGWRDRQVCEEGEIESKKVTASEWSFGVGTGASLMERLKAAGPNLGSMTEIFVGLQTSADTVFLFKEWKTVSGKITRGFSKELNEWVEVESALLKSVVRSGAIGRYWSNPEAKVLFPYEFEDGKAKLIPESRFAKSFPKAWAYLNQNKSLLANREHGKFKASGWYQLYPKNLDLWERPKLLVPYMITESSACLDTDNTYFVNVTTGGFGIVSTKREFSLKYLCGLINSRPLNFYLKQVSTNFRGGYFAANKQFIEQLPIRAIDFSKPADKARHDKLVVLVDKMLGLMPKLRAATSDREKAALQNAVTATDQQIDALVYDLYGLTEEEIQLVEGGQ